MVVDYYYNGRSVNYVSYICCVVFLRSLRLLRTCLRVLRIRCVRWMETPLNSVYLDSEDPDA